MAPEPARNPGQSLSHAQRRRLFGRVLLRSLGSAVVLVILYYLLPLQALRGTPVWISLSVALLLLLVVIVLQVRGVTASRYPGIYAVEALAVTVPFYLLMFASAYVVMAQDNAANFNTHQLTRTDSLYFVLTTFSTVGFGDITATSQSARVLVMVQVVLDLVILGLVVQVFRGAVQVGRQRATASSDLGTEPGPAEKETPDQGQGSQHE
jgi:voltage-gated potassium channel